MDQISRGQVRLILEDLGIRAGRTASNRLTAIYAKRAATRSLRSGATIKSVVTAVDEMAAAFITRCVEQVAPVAKDVEAFSMIEEVVEDFLRFLAGKVDTAAQMATGVDPDGSVLARTTAAARRLFGGSQTDLRRQLELHRFAFTVPQTQSVNSGSPAPAPQKNRGGKPRAAHWDEMWAAIAVMLYAGDLARPETNGQEGRQFVEGSEVGGTASAVASSKERSRGSCLRASDRNNGQPKN